VKIWIMYQSARFNKKRKKRKTNHSFVGDRFNKAVEDLCKSMGTDPRTADIVRVLIHTLSPVVTSVFQNWRASSRITVVTVVISCASSHLRKHLGYGDTCLFIDIATDGCPEAVEDVHDAADEEHVEEKLCVKGEDVG
jgi:hypothetical protein